MQKQEWRKQRAILQESSRYSKELGFAMFFLNRTNRSGILDAGPIGGYDQSGTYKIDSRLFYVEFYNHTGSGNMGRVF